MQCTAIASQQRGKTPRNECPAYETKQNDCEAPVMLELLVMQSNPSLSGGTW